MNINGTKRLKILALALIGAVIALAIYGTLVEPYLLDVHHVWIEDFTPGKVLRDRIVVHLSDLHMDSIGRREERVLEVLDDLDPDFIFLTGDYVHWKGDCQAALEFLGRLQARIGVWAVMGDYDYSFSRKCCLFCHEPGTGRPSNRHAVRFLRNSAEAVRLPEGEIVIGGLDKRDLAPLNGPRPHILLSHNPLSFDALPGNRDLLVLAGDTHGGQVPLPSRVWNMLGYEKCAKYSRGHFRKNRKQMYVNQGVGTSQIPVRIARRPELTVLHFNAAR